MDADLRCSQAVGAPPGGLSICSVLPTQLTLVQHTEAAMRVLSLVMVGFALVGVFIYIPFVSSYAFWVLVAAYVFLAASHKHGWHFHWDWD